MREQLGSGAGVFPGVFPSSEDPSPPHYLKRSSVYCTCHSVLAEVGSPVYLLTQTNSSFPIWKKSKCKNQLLPHPRAVSDSRARTQGPPRTAPSCVHQPRQGLGTASGCILGKQLHLPRQPGLEAGDTAGSSSTRLAPGLRGERSPHHHSSPRACLGLWGSPKVPKEKGNKPRAL